MWCVFGHKPLVPIQGEGGVYDIFGVYNTVQITPNTSQIFDFKIRDLVVIQSSEPKGLIFNWAILGKVWCFASIFVEGYETSKKKMFH